MSEPLPDPIREVLRDPVDEVAVQRMWRQIAARRAQGGAGASSRPSAVRYVAGGGVVLAVAAAAVFAVVWRGRAAGEPGPLRLASGGEVAVSVDVPRGEGRDGRLLELNDGSRVTAAPGARLEVLENTGRTFATHLSHGRVAFEVHPGGPRRWSVECGVATVEVVGTGFVIDRRREDTLRVDVLHGVVLVRGEHVRDRVQRLTAGQWIEVGGAGASAVAAREEDASDAEESAVNGAGGAAAESPAGEPEQPAAEGTDSGARGGEAAEPGASQAGEPEEPPSPARPGRSATPRATQSGAHPAAASDWRALAGRSAYEQAYAALGEGGVARETRAVSSADDLMRLAEVAMRSHHFSEAAAPLERVLDEHPGGPIAMQATLTLARLELEQLGHAPRAATLFARAYADPALPQALRESALFDLVAARARAGDAAGARAAAAEFERRFPQSRRLPEVRRRAGAAP